MSRTIDISLASEKSDGLVEELRHVDGIVSISLQPGASLKPRGDVLTIHATNEGLQNVMALLAKYDIGEQASVLTSEPRSLVAPFSQNQLEKETNEATWPEMAALLRRETNITSNYLIAMFSAGVVAAGGLWSDVVHIVVGAMVIAPGFEPIIRMPFGILASSSRALQKGLGSTAAGYAALMLGAALALIAMQLVAGSDGSLGDRQWVQYWTSIKFVSVLIALAAGAAGAAIIAAQRSVLTAGVMIALALVPSASIVGMAVIAGEPELAGRALMRWAVDAGCVVVAGGLVFLVKRGSRHRRHAPARASGPL